MCPSNPDSDCIAESKMTEKEHAELLRLLGGHRGPCKLVLVRSLQKKSSSPGHVRDVKLQISVGPVRYQILRSGAYMEDEGKLMQMAAQEVERARDLLRKASTDIVKLADITIPALVEEVNHLRSIRMSLISEMKQIVEGLNSVREFFAAGDYEEEMKKIERFLSYCSYFKKFKEDGTMDAITDAAIHLAVKQPIHEESKNGGK